MDMTHRVPDWVTPVAWTCIALCLLSAAYLAHAVRVRGDPDGSTADDLVWITSALYLGPFAVVLHHRHSRSRPTGPAGDVAVAGLPGGSASAVAHVIGVPLVVASGLTIAGIDLWVMILTIGVLAIGLLFVHERTATRRTGPSPTVGRALTVAVVTVLAFDLGMGGWMLLLHYSSLMPPATEGSFWFLMQIGVLCGLATGWPVVAGLARRRRVAAPA